MPILIVLALAAVAVTGNLASDNGSGGTVAGSIGTTLVISLVVVILAYFLIRHFATAS